ncbi:unnamed protein product, partial [marine sediment metagenome]
MAKLRENEHLFSDYSDGIVSTDLSTLAAIGTFGFIYPGNWNANLFSIAKV